MLAQGEKKPPRRVAELFSSESRGSTPNRPTDADRFAIVAHVYRHVTSISDALKNTTPKGGEGGEVSNSRQALKGTD